MLDVEFVFPTRSDRTIGSLKGKGILQGTFIAGAYRLHLENQDVYAFTATQDEAKLLHSRMGHLNYTEMKKLHRYVTGAPRLGEEAPFCEPCTAGKLSRSPSHKNINIRTENLDLIHADLAIMPTHSIGGAKYLAGVTIDSWRWKIVKPLAKKNDFFTWFLTWKTQIEKETGF